jgi:hypothetical protein
MGAYGGRGASPFQEVLPQLIRQQTAIAKNKMGLQEEGETGLDPEGPFLLVKLAHPSGRAPLVNPAVGKPLGKEGTDDKSVEGTLRGEIGQHRQGRTPVNGEHGGLQARLGPENPRINIKLHPRGPEEDDCRAAPVVNRPALDRPDAEIVLDGRSKAG